MSWPVPVGSRDLVTGRAFQGGLLGGETSPGPHGSSVAGVETLDGIGRADDFADLYGVVQERDELFPGVSTQPADRRVALPLFGRQLLEGG